MKLNILGGLLVGLMANLIFYGLHFTGLLRTPDGAKVLFLASGVHAAVIILVLSRHRSQALPEAIPFAKLMGAGLFLSLVAGLCTAAGLLVFTTQVDKTHLAWVVEQSTEQAKTMGLSEAELQAHIASLPELVTPWSLAFQGLAGTCIVGFFLSLVIGALLRLRAVQLVNSEKVARPPG